MEVSAAEARMTREWEKAIGARVRETMASPEIERYFSIKMTASWARALKAADDALELFKLYHLGVAEEMEKLD